MWVSYSFVPSEARGKCKYIEGQFCVEVLFLFVFYRLAQKLPLFHLALSDCEVGVLECGGLHATRPKLDCVARVDIVAPFHIACGLFEIVVDAVHHCLVCRLVPGVNGRLKLPQGGCLIPRGWLLALISGQVGIWVECTRKYISEIKSGVSRCGLTNSKEWNVGYGLPGVKVV